jgi:hypothetical protein
MFDYVSKPVQVQAYHLAKLESNETQAFPGWLMPAVMNGTINLETKQCKTRQGLVAFKDDDWLIRLSDGEIYPCSNEVFTAKYEQVPGVRDA